MKYHIAICLFLLFPSFCNGEEPKKVVNHIKFGGNLNGPADYSTEYSFADEFKLSREWISQKKNAPWGQGPKVERDSDGWVKRLEPNCWVETVVFTVNNGHTPKGNYTCLYDGEGTLEFLPPTKTISRSPGKLILNFENNKESVFLAINKTNPQNYIRNIRIIMPDNAETYETQPFYRPFLEKWKTFNTFRFMDWMLTNNSNVKNWEDRPTPSFCNFTEKGVPVEYMVNLCNQLKINPWFCMPHQANDDYVREFAKLVKSTLDPSLKVYIEYSNEVWNSGFQQQHYAQEQGAKLNLGSKERPWEGAAMYYGIRSQEIFHIWEQVFEGRERLVRVIAWQAASSSYWTDTLLLGQNNTGKNADVLAIAPYMSLNVGPNTDPNVQTVSRWSVDELLDYVEHVSLQNSIQWMKTQKQVADKYGLKFVCYEAGQHLVGITGGENNDAMTSLFHKANRHPRMGEIYKKYIDAWNQIGGDLICFFVTTSKWTKWGSWGLTEYLDETVNEQPKFKAVMEWKP